MANNIKTKYLSESFALLKVIRQDVEEYAIDDSINAKQMKLYGNYFCKDICNNLYNEDELNKLCEDFYEYSGAVYLMPCKVWEKRLGTSVKDYHKFIKLKGEEN